MGTTVRHLLLLAVVVTALLPGGAFAASASALGPDDTGGLVIHLQRQLAGLGLYRGEIDGEYGAATAQAVMAFHKHLGLERTFEWTRRDWRYLRHFERPQPLAEDQIVVDLDRQLLYLHRAGSVAIIPISSGNGELYRGRGGRLVRAATPEGTFQLYRHIDGVRRSYLGSLWRPWYFRGGYAIHGSSSVPAYPASHGCVRVPNWEADWLSGQLSLGMKITVGRGGVPVPPEIQPLGPSRIIHTPAGPTDPSGRVIS